MKRFKKIITIIIIALLLVILSSTFIIKGTLGANIGSDIIYGFIWAEREEDKKHNVKYDLSKYEGKTVKLVQSYDRIYQNEGTGQYNTLNQPNIWCVQHGAELAYGEYKVSKQYTVLDPVLAYILSHGPTTQQTTYKDKWQYMLWFYLEDTADYGKKGSDGLTDKARIKDGIKTATKLTEAEKNAINSEYKKILEYAKNINASEISMSEIEINGNKATFTIKGNYESLKIYINGTETKDWSKSDKGVITVNISKVDTSTLEITAEASTNVYSAKYRILYADTNLDPAGKPLQRLLVNSWTSNSETKTTTDSKEVDLKTDVSLQKYITKVNGNSVSSSRENKKTYSTDKNEKVKDQITPTITASDSYKYNSAVRIEPGDKVTYRIYVYNNSTSVKATNITVKDRLPYYYTGKDKTFKKTGNKGIAVSTEKSDIIIKDAKGNNVKWSSIVNSDNGCTDLSWTTGELAAATSTYYDVTLKFNKYLSGIIENTAWISSSTPNNSGTYRTVDRDYVQMQQYSVSLEKYVTAVNQTAITGRENHPIYVSYYDYNNDGKLDKNDSDLILRYSAGLETAPKGKIVDLDGDGKVTAADARKHLNILCNKGGFSKQNNPVSVEVGDEVTYTIKLTNTGDTVIKVSKIQDTFDENNNANIVYVDNSITGYGNASVEKKNGQLNITIANPEEIAPGESKYLTLKFKVEVPVNNTDKEQLLENTAEVTEITNKNDIIVSDSDGETNNKDSDWIKTKLYSVSLEKYVTAVNQTVVTGRENNPIYVSYYDYNNDGKLDKNDSELILRYSTGLETAPKGKIVDLDGDGKVTAADARKHLNILCNKGGFSKQNNPVSVEVGDEVTYTIKLTNTGDTVIKVSKIQDTFDGNNNANIVYVDNSITGYGNASVEKKNGQLDITISNPEEIAPGDSKYLTLKFKVEVPFDNTTKEQVLKNTAEVTEIKNRKDIPVLDADGKTNNKDSDWIKTKTYAVSLEKFVSAVNGETITGREGKPEHNKDDNTNTWNNAKYKNVVTVSNEDKVTYTIKVTNDGDTLAKITNIADLFPNGVKYNNTEYKGDEYCDPKTFNNGSGEIDANKVDFSNEISLNPKESKTFTVEVEVTEPNISVNILKNVAKITSMKNKNNYDVKDTTENNNKDADYIQVEYKEDEEEKTTYSVEKIWTGKSSSKPTKVTVKLFKVENGREIDLGMESEVLSDANDWEHTWNDLPVGVKYIAREYSEDGSNIVKGNTKYNANTTTTYQEITNGIEITNNYNNDDDDDPLKTSYTVEKVWQDENNLQRPTSIKVRLLRVVEEKETKVEDITLNFGNWSYTWNNLDKYDEDGKLIEYTVKELKDGFISDNVLEEGEKYNNDYTVHYLDSTNKTTITNTKESTDIPEELEDIAISGIVWNDKALDKTQSTYDGIKDEQENFLSEIKVMLYRENKGVVATTYTNLNGEYCFTNASLDQKLPENERYIKGPKVPGEDRWLGTYYSYYVLFEYDGITYTSTKFAEYTTINPLDSNAKENNGRVKETRENFNKKFNNIQENRVFDANGNYTCNLSYSTVNENGYTPQSIHKYNEKMLIQSSTDKIELENSLELESQLKHINLGLRGRDVFDLELTSDVYSTKVTVNGIDGGYNYNANKVTVRRNDLNNYNYREDAANIYYEGSEYVGESYIQNVRNTDIDVAETKSNYATTGLKIEVTYKITVTNASNSAGTATEIINYYDTKYFVKDVKAGKNCTIKGYDCPDGDDYNIVVIRTNGNALRQNESMEIYIVYELNDPVSEFNKYPTFATYNMSEISSYSTEATNNNEATRGLIDKDSAPRSAESEKVRLHPDRIGDVSTVQYYFGGNDLSVLKYEDDTYATPTLYFAADNSERIIEGTVFEDITTVDSDTKIKTGNGKLDEGEVGVYGAIVELIEIKDGTETVRYQKATLPDDPTTSQNELGTFSFEGFLPGNYIIRYSYGNTKNTVLLKQSGEVNATSYNGEDYQSTNNTGTYGASKLSNEANYWYVYNESEGISTATDNSTRRATVSDNVVAFNDEQMIVLNKIRRGETVTEEETNFIIGQTNMSATTEIMLFTVEETIDLNKFDKTTLLEENKVNIIKDSNGISLATWAMFPSEDNEYYKEYRIEKMNFGIAEVPVTTIDLQKHINTFAITDSTGQNIIARAGLDENGKWKVDVGNVTPSTDGYLTQIEDDKLQGARLEVTYNITVNMKTEVNFDGTKGIVPTITGIVDFISNNLSYDSTLGENERFWEIATYGDVGSKQGILSELSKMQYDSGTIPVGTVDPEGKLYTTILRAKAGNPLLLTQAGTATATVTLEKILSPVETTIDQIVTKTIDTLVYFNTVEIIGFDYTNSEVETEEGTKVMRDRIRNEDGFVILPGVQYDYATSEEIAITPPTGDDSINMVYLLITVISLTILAIGVFGIRKFVIKK